MRHRLKYAATAGRAFVLAGGWRSLHTKFGWRMVFGCATLNELRERGLCR